jgi:hypothetical protein
MLLRPVHLLLLAALCCVTAQPALAAGLNMAVAARVVSFLQPPPSGAIGAVILFDPGDAESEAEAAAIERIIGNGMAIGKASLHVKRLPASQLGALAGVKVAFVTTGLRDRQADIAAAAQKNGVLTVTADLGCVQAGRCAVAVSNSPQVQITVSRAACKAARIQFGSAFLMLVKEI